MLRKTELLETIYYGFLNLLFQVTYSDEIRNTNIFLVLLFCKFFEYNNFITNQKNLYILYSSKIINFTLSMYIIMTIQLRWLFVSTIIVNEFTSTVYTYEIGKLISLNNLN